MGDAKKTRRFDGGLVRHEPVRLNIVTDGHKAVIWENLKPTRYVCKVQRKNDKKWQVGAGHLVVDQQIALELGAILNELGHEFADLRKKAGGVVQATRTHQLLRTETKEPRLLRVNGKPWLDYRGHLVVGEDDVEDMLVMLQTICQLYHAQGVRLNPPNLWREKYVPESPRTPETKEVIMPRPKKRNWHRRRYFRLSLPQIAVIVLLAVLLDCLRSLTHDARENQQPILIYEREGRHYLSPGRF